MSVVLMLRIWSFDGIYKIPVEWNIIILDVHTMQVACRFPDFNTRVFSMRRVLHSRNAFPASNSIGYFIEEVDRDL